jgi:CheY-like chemotaxis protein
MEAEGREICVLAVDDDEGVRLLLSVVLTEERCRVLTASDGVEAAEILKAEPVDLLITDYAMPRMDGLELIRWTRACFRDVETVLITGHDDPALMNEAKSCGALRVFLKPFPIETLLSLAAEIRRTRPISRVLPRNLPARA